MEERKPSEGSIDSEWLGAGESSTRRLRAFRRRGALWIAAVTALGFATKFHQGAGAAWIHPYGGAVLYEIFWILVVAWLRPALPPGGVAAAVFLATSLLECLQLSNAAPLAALRTTFLGRTLIGTTFDPLDFVHYAIGCGMGWILVRFTRRPLWPSAARRS